MDVIWKLWTTPEDIMQWNNASDDWHTPSAKNDRRPGGKILFRMEAKDERKVGITFTGKETETRITETFEAESQNPIEMQRNGWQAILNNFKQYAERKS